MATPALAQHGAGAVLMVEDDGWSGGEVTERLGVTLYSRFLEAGPYEDLQVVVGREDANARLARAIDAAAQGRALVDVFLSVHTTTRTYDELRARLSPAAAAKLRLVYSTACYGNDEERDAWERLGARTVVTHVGINNPVVALPFFLSRWLEGAPVDATVTEGYRETRAVSNYFLSLPGMSGEGFGGDFVEGSRPVVSGDRALTITSGLPHDARAPRELRYRRDRGGPLGLALRALAGRFSVDNGEIQGLLARLQLSALPIPQGELKKAERLRVQWHTEGERAELELKLRDKIVVPLEQGFKLKLSTTVTLRPGKFDAAARRVEIHTSGVWITKGLLKVRLSKLTVLPNPDGSGYAVRANVGLFGIIPFRKTLPIGGWVPSDDGDASAIFRPRAVDVEGIGVAEALTLATD